MIVALVVAAGALYLALDARDKYDRANSETAAVRKRLDAFRPTLIVQARGGDPFAGPHVAPDGATHNLSQGCGPGAVVVGGGYNFFGDVLVGGSLGTDGSWLVNVVNNGAGRTRVSPAALCARGEGGLHVKATRDLSARATTTP